MSRSTIIIVFLVFIIYLGHSSLYATVNMHDGLKEMTEPIALNDSEIVKNDILQSLTVGSKPKHSTWEVVAMVFAGIGLLMAGIRFVSDSMKKIANRQLRKVLAKWTKSRFLSAIWGVLCGAVSQSSTSSGFFLVSFVSSGMLPLKKAMFILSWADIGTAILVFLASANIKLTILYFIAVTGIAYSFDKKRQHDAPLMACFGLGVLLLGFNFVKSSATGLADLEWMKNVMALAEGSLFLLFVVGVVLRMVTQSSSAVTILCIPLIQSGIISLPQAVAIISGISLGSAFSLPLLGNDLKGLSRQLLLYKSVLYSITGFFLLILLFIKSPTGDSYLVFLLNKFVGQPELQISFMFLFMKVCPITFSILSGNKIKKLVAKLSPVTVEEKMSTLFYFHDQALSNPESAIDLVKLETQRILTRLPDYLNVVREEEVKKELETKEIQTQCEQDTGQNELLMNSAKNRLDSVHETSIALGTEINAVLSDLFKMDMGHMGSERLLRVQNQHQTIMDIEDSVYQLVVLLKKGEQTHGLETLMFGMKEGLHNMLVFANDIAEGETDGIPMLHTMTSDNGGMMENLRRNYQSSDKKLNNEAKILMLQLTNHYQRMVWLIHRWTELQ